MTKFASTQLTDKLVGDLTTQNSMHIVRNGYAAHIFISNNAGSPLFHYTVHRIGSTEILHWGQEASMSEAQSAVDELLDSKT
ncbi:MAG: hypothetical protein JWO13_483 [Acidobacteriales bacterium]|nr:hypothetical protein [Terriglobales bacterium]